MNAKRIVIVGAGITGLTAAALLQARGERVVLLETAESVGGLCRSHTLDSTVFDLGPHLFLANPAIESHRFIFDLLKDEPMTVNPFHFAIEAQGRQWVMPLNPPDIILGYPWGYKRELLLARLGKNPPSQADPRSARAMMEGKSGPSLYRDVFGPFTRRKTGVDGGELHRDWAERVDRDVRNRKVAFTGFGRLGLGQKLAATLFPKYHYPLRGFTAIAEALWRRFTAAGGRTVLACGEPALVVKQGKVAEVVAGGESHPADHLVWTASANDLFGRLGAPAPPLPYADNYIVMLTYERRSRARRRFAYTYHTDPGLIFNRLYYPAHLLGAAAPAACEGLCAEVLAEGDDTAGGGERALQAVCQGVERLGLHRRADLRQSLVVHLRHCMPVYPLDYEERMAQAFAAAHAIPNLHAVGRRGGFFFCQTPNAVEQGMKMARHLAGT